MSEATEKTPWKDGYWQSSWNKERILKIKESIVEDWNIAVAVQDYPFQGYADYPPLPGKWSFGQFEKASNKLMKKTGVSVCNMRMALGISETGGTAVLYGILSKSGPKCHVQLGSKEIGKIQWLDDDDMMMILGSVELLNRRSHHYKIQPENQGKIFFFSAPPILGYVMFMAAQKLAQ